MSPIRKKPGDTPPKPVIPGIYANILNGLNAFGVLEDQQERPIPSWMFFGPKEIYKSSPNTYAGVVMWYRPTGIYHYQTITLLGIWVAGTMEKPEIIIGTRILTYTAPFYVAESYLRHMRQEFEIFYGSDAPPPIPENCLYAAPYDVTRRLAMRREVETAVQQWRQKLIHP